MKKLVVLAVLLAVAVAFAADTPPIGIQTLFKTAPKPNPAGTMPRLVGMQGSTLVQLPLSSAKPALATTSTAGIVKVGTGLAMDSDGKLNNTGIAGVASFNGRGGAVTPGFSDYSASMIKGLKTVAKTGIYNDLTGKPTIPAAQVNSDWNASSGVAQILNKPTIPTALSQLTQDATHRTVTDAEKATWNTSSASVNSVNGQTGTVTLNATDVGADPLGSATSVQTNLTVHAGATNNPHSVTKAQVGLGNADNTSDAAKPISTATQAALDLFSASFKNYTTTDRLTKADVGSTVTYYTCTGDNDDAGINAALAAASSSPVGRGIVQLAGTATCDLQAHIRMQPNTVLRGQGKYHLQHLRVHDKVQTTLTADAAAGQSTVTVANVAGLKAGQLVTIFDSAHNTYNNGDSAVITAVNGTTKTLTLQSPLYRSYTVSNGAYIFTSYNAVNFNDYTFITGYANPAATNIAVNSAVENCNIDGNQANNTLGNFDDGQGGIYLANAHHSEIKNNYIHDTIYAGITATHVNAGDGHDGNEYLLIQANRVENTLGKEPLHNHGTKFSRIVDNEFSNPFSASASSLIYTYLTNDNTFANNTLTGGLFGFTMGSGSRNVITGGSINSYSNGVDISSVANVQTSIIGVNFNGSTKSGANSIEIRSGAPGVKITGCTMSGSNGQSIYDEGNGTLISGNHIIQSTVHEAIYSAAPKSIITSNWIQSTYSTKQKGIISSGAGTVIAGNYIDSTATNPIASTGADAVVYGNHTDGPISVATPATLPVSGTITATGIAGTAITDSTSTTSSTTAASATAVKAAYDLANGKPSLTSTAPNMDGVASAGSGVTAARVDHVHPTDTTRAGTDNPTFTTGVTSPIFTSNAADGTHYVSPYNTTAYSGTCSKGMVQTVGTPATLQVCTADGTWGAVTGAVASVNGNTGTITTSQLGAYYPGGTDVAIADGGTGASTAAGALANLGGIGGTVGSTADRIPVASGTGGSTLKASGATIDPTTGLMKVQEQSGVRDVLGMGDGSLAHWAGWTLAGTLSGDYYLALPTSAPTAGQTMVTGTPATVTVDGVSSTVVPVTFTANTVSSGSYTPIATAGSNASAVTPYTAYWQRIGNVVSVWGQVDASATSANTMTTVLLTLPAGATSAFTDAHDLEGLGSGYINPHSGTMQADVATGKAALIWYDTTTGAINWKYSFAYTVK